jgi:chromosome segregation ATPase
MIVSAKKYTELQATFEATQAALASSEAVVSSLNTELATLRASFEESVKAVDSLTTVKAELEEKITALSEAKAAVEASVAGFEEKVKAAAEEKALQTVASTGTPVIEKTGLEVTGEVSTKPAAPKSYAEFNSTFNALSEKDPAAAGVYFDAHCSSFFKNKK